MTRFLSPRLFLAALLCGGALSGVRPVSAAPKTAPCAVCSVREGAGPEPVRATAVHAGREFLFCSGSCRAEFLKDPAAFAQAGTSPPAEKPEEHRHPRPGSAAPS